MEEKVLLTNLISWLCDRSRGNTGEHPNETAKVAADELIRNVKAGGCVDEHLQDQVRGTEWYI